MKNLDTPVIVVHSESLRPMSWDGDQFAYVSPIKLNSTRASGFSVKTYTRCDALILVKSHNEFRRLNKFHKTELLLMLVTHGKC